MTESLKGIVHFFLDFVYVPIFIVEVSFTILKLTFPHKNEIDFCSSPAKLFNNDNLHII